MRVLIQGRLKIMFHHKSVGYIKTVLHSLIFFLISNLLSATPPQQNNIPERIILNLTETPSTSQAVTWRTNADVFKAQAQIARANEYTDLSNEARTVFATTEEVKLDDKRRVNHHSVIFDSLTPNTLYAYRVGGAKDWSEWNQFKTATEVFEPFKFIYLGDPQNNIKSMCSRIFREAYKKAPDAGFWLLTGDIVNNGYDDEQWAELYYALGWIPGITPMILLPGNHGYRKVSIDDKEIRKLNPLWRPQFTLPENGPNGLEETAYFIDYQGVRFVMLNGNEKLEEQAKWLDSILNRNPQRWTIVAIHQPFYSTGRKRDNPHLRKLFLPVFEEYSVDLVLQGHDHTYGRTHKLREGMKVADDAEGTVYVVSVSGTKVYPINQRYEDLMAKMGAGRQLFQVISVDNDYLLYESFNAMGELYDSFELNK